jgi:membrane protein
LLYRHAPNRRGAQVPWITPGAVIALVTWAAGSFAFSIYLRNFGSLNEVYGSIGAVIALLLWFYLSAYVVLLGALLNAEIELETACDTTIGEPRPAGQRDAFVADHVADSEGKLHPAEIIEPRNTTP